MTDEQLSQSKKLYGRLTGIQRSLTKSSIDPIIVNDINSIVDKFGTIFGEDMVDLSIPRKALNDYGNFRADIVHSKVDQLLSYLESGYGLGSNIVEPGSLINAIHDEELRARCVDLLSAPSRFDRVVNQATLVLEDRIRQKSGIQGFEGTKLVNEACKSVSRESVLILDHDNSVHEGLVHTLRGMMMGYRNQAHHTVNNQMTREESLKICGFIDVLLSVVETARKQNL